MKVMPPGRSAFNISYDMAATAPAVLAQTVDIETPELVGVTYTVAGVGSRAYAAIIDYFICVVGFIVVTIGILTFFDRVRSGLAREASVAWAAALMILVQFVVLWGYYVLFEALADGQTPGKRALRLRVVRDGGYSITFGASAVRNLVRIVDMQPLLVYAVGMVSVVISRSGKRLGDIAAGTIVVQEGIVRQPSAAAPARSGTALEPLPLQAALRDDEYEVLDRFMLRRAALDHTRRQALADQLVGRFAPALGEDDGSPAIARLAHLHSSERSARERGVSARLETGAGRERHAIVARGSQRWATFASHLADAQRRGLKQLGEARVREFVREYRDVTADLARLRTAAHGRDTDDVFYLNRLVAGAHNLLYRRRALPLRDITHFLFTDVPREIRASALPIALAAALMFGPAFIAYTAVVTNPANAAALVPPAMLDRADDGVRRAKDGQGYITDPQLFRPVMATSIIANNVQVALGAFAFGMTFGVLTAWVLLSNGVSLGAVSGLYASKGIGTLLLAFVAPHGVLELTAICIAGGAGFLLAAGLLIPGNRTRGEALVHNGRRAIRLVAGAAMLLVVAGALEGFVSPIEWWPLEGKLAVSGLTAVALYLFLRLGVRRPGDTSTARPSP